MSVGRIQRQSRKGITLRRLRHDTIPVAFSFVDRTDVDLESIVTSAPISVEDITVAASISVSGDISSLYSIDGGNFTSGAGTVVNGATVRVRHTASASYVTAVDTILTIGGISDTFTSTTVQSPLVFAKYNSADKASQIDTLTDSDHTAAKSADSGNWRSIRADTAIVEGDAFYFEVVFNAAPGNDILFGFATAAAAILNSYTGSVGGSIGYQTNFGIPYGTWSIGGALFNSLSNGSRVGIAVRRTAGAMKFWMIEVGAGGADGEWNGDNANHNPSTLTGGHTISDATMLAAANLFFALSINVPSVSVTIHTDPADHVGAMPTSFSPYASNA